MSAKEQAIQDIKSELAKEGKSFLAFRRSLNPVMRALVKEQISEQSHVSKCINGFSKCI